jgi:FkbM family methyltransferase
MFSFFKKKNKTSPIAPPDAAVKSTLESIKRMQFLPKHIVDIGGNHGGWSRMALSVFPDAKISMFEPQTRLSKYLEDLECNPNVKIHYKGVGNFDGNLPFTFHDRDDSCSFVYEAEDAVARGFSQADIEICRLDTAMAGNSFGMPSIVKIDAEGLDLQVLEGGNETLRTSDLVFVEASVANKDYPNTVLVVVNKMDTLGYRLFDITDLNRTPKRKFLWLLEMVFVRKGSMIDKAATHFD